MILCDTNILIEFYKGNAQITEGLRAIGSDNIAISVITQAELYYGALDKAELKKLKDHLENIHTYPIDSGASARFIRLMESYTLSHRLSIPDALIAATALTYDIELYTLNVRDFRYIPSLTLYKP